jgi:hypothetical protein
MHILSCSEYIPIFQSNGSRELMDGKISVYWRCVICESSMLTTYVEGQYVVKSCSKHGTHMVDPAELKAGRLLSDLLDKVLDVSV